jgi:hypothetical protein
LVVPYLCSTFCIFNRPILEKYVSQVEGGPHLLQSCLRAIWNGLPLVAKEIHLSFESLVVISTRSLQAFLMDIHHNTSLRSILEDDSISLASRACIRFCSSKGVGLYLIVRPSINSLCITHYIFTLALCFHLSLIQPSASGLLICECGHRLDASGTHLAHCPFDSHTWCHPKRHVCPHSKKWAHCMERMVIHLYVRSFITNWILHDLKGPSLCCWCGSYWLDVRDGGFKCH